MTGAYLRVKRKDKWENIEIEHLTDKEREIVLKDDPRLMQWLHIVCNELVSIDKLLKELEESGVISKKNKKLPNGIGGQNDVF